MQVQMIQVFSDAVIKHWTSRLLDELSHTPSPRYLSFLFHHTTIACSLLMLWFQQINQNISSSEFHLYFLVASSKCPELLLVAIVLSESCQCRCQMKFQLNFTGNIFQKCNYILLFPQIMKINMPSFPTVCYGESVESNMFLPFSFIIKSSLAKQQLFLNVFPYTPNSKSIDKAI